MSQLRSFSRLRIQKRMWVIPTIYIVSVLILARLTAPLSTSMILPGVREFFSSPETATSTLSAIVSGMIAFTGIVFSMIFVMVQYGSSQYSPRVTSYFLESPVVQHALGIFIATFLYSLITLMLIDANSSIVPDIPLLFSVLFVLGSVAMFIVLIRHIASLQVSNVLHMIGQYGRAVIEELYPQPYRPSQQNGDPPASLQNLPPSTQKLIYRGGPLVVVRIDLPALVELARLADATIGVEYPVGDTIPNEAHLLTVWGGSSQIPESQLRRSVVLGVRRTVDQDLKYAMRLIVDISIKALSPSANDPTTAVQGLDQLDDLLRRLGQRQLDIGTRYDQAGALRVVYPTPTWDDFLALALDEIRHHGASSLQVTRRLRALLQELERLLPTERRRAVKNHLMRLEASVERSFIDDDERAEAEQADRQGLGLSARRRFGGE